MHAWPMAAPSTWLHGGDMQRQLTAAHMCNTSTFHYMLTVHVIEALLRPFALPLPTCHYSRLMLLAARLAGMQSCWKGLQISPVTGVGGALTNHSLLSDLKGARKLPHVDELVVGGHLGPVPGEEGKEVIMQHNVVPAQTRGGLARAFVI